MKYVFTAGVLLSIWGGAGFLFSLIALLLLDRFDPKADQKFSMVSDVNLISIVVISLGIGLMAISAVSEIVSLTTAVMPHHRP